MICGHITLPLKCKKDFPSNRHLPKKKNYSVRFLSCRLCYNKKLNIFVIYVKNVFHSSFIYFTGKAHLKKYSILPSLQFWPNFNMLLNPKIKMSFREIWVRYKSLVTHCFRKMNNWVTYTVICFKNCNLDTKYYLSLFPKYCGIFLFVLTIFHILFFKTKNEESGIKCKTFSESKD